MRSPEVFNNLTWRGYYFPPFSKLIYSLTLITTVGILLIALIKTKSQRRESQIADFLLMGLGATLASPIAWEHHYGILFPIFVCMWLILWFGDSPLKSMWVKIAFVTCYLVAANVFPFVKFTASSYLNILQSYLFFAACGMFILLVLIKHQFKSNSSA